MRTAAIHSGARRIYGILGTAIVVRTRGGTPVRVGVFVDVCVGVEDAHAVKPLECRGPRTQYAVKPYPFLGVNTVFAELRKVASEECPTGIGELGVKPAKKKGAHTPYRTRTP